MCNHHQTNQVDFSTKAQYIYLILLARQVCRMPIAIVSTRSAVQSYVAEKETSKKLHRIDKRGIRNA